ncbi:MAG: hypothetical protein JWM09_650 [Francisellaceae bacterium]|nr:hypothetical protein [Francisellaceae bacterium]
MSTPDPLNSEAKIEPDDKPKIEPQEEKSDATPRISPPETNAPGNTLPSGTPAIGPVPASNDKNLNKEPNPALNVSTNLDPTINAEVDNEGPTINANSNSDKAKEKTKEGQTSIATEWASLFKSFESRLFDNKERKDAVQEIQSQINKFNENINETKTKLVTLEKELNDLTNKKNDSMLPAEKIKLGEDISVREKQIKEYELSIRNNTIERNVLEEQLNRLNPPLLNPKAALSSMFGLTRWNSADEAGQKQLEEATRLNETLKYDIKELKDNGKDLQRKLAINQRTIEENELKLKQLKLEPGKENKDLEEELKKLEKKQWDFEVKLKKNNEEMNEKLQEKAQHKSTLEAVERKVFIPVADELKERFLIIKKFFENGGTTTPPIKGNDNQSSNQVSTPMNKLGNTEPQKNPIGVELQENLEEKSPHKFKP